MAVVFGIDISHHQHGLSLAAVQAQGYDFVIAKASQGQGVRDPDFQTFREEAQSLGLMFAAYHFLHSDSPARAQADNLAGQLAGHTEIPVMVDVEPTEGSEPTLVHTKKFIAACAKRDLRVTILYLPHFHWQALGEPQLDPELPPLMQALYGRNRRGAGSALYPGNTSPRWAAMGGRNPILLQFGSRGRIDGFDKLKVDIDAFRGTRQELSATGMLLAGRAKKASARKSAQPVLTAVGAGTVPAQRGSGKTAAKKAPVGTSAAGVKGPHARKASAGKAATAVVTATPPAKKHLAKKMVPAQRQSAPLSAKNMNLTARWLYPSGAIHAGYDYAVPIGTPVFAVRHGRILKIRDDIHNLPKDKDGKSGDPPNFILQGFHYKHEPATIVYMHVSPHVLVNEGDEVEAGQQIALSGHNGHSTGPHLHISVMKGHHQLPFDYLKDLLDNSARPVHGLASNGITIFPPRLVYPNAVPHALAGGVVVLEDLQFGTMRSDSVRRLQHRLNRISLVGGEVLPMSGNYLDRTRAEVALWQVQKGHATPGTEAANGNVQPDQARILFGPSFQLVRRI